MADDASLPHPAPVGGATPPSKATGKTLTKPKKAAAPAVAQHKGPRKAARTPAAKKRPAAGKGKPKSGRQSAAVMSKADLIRKVAGIIKAKGEKPRPVDIVRILGEEGVKVSNAQVSQTLKAAGFRPLRKRRKAAAGGSAKAAAGRPAGAADRISIEDLLAAKSVSGAFGGTDQAIAVLQALKRLER